MLLQNSFQVCGIGCLKCTEDDFCEICDPTNSFYLSSNKCQKSTKTNCRTIDRSDNCILCASGFFLEKSTFQCLQISVLKKIENCDIYSSSFSCEVCKEEHFVKGGSCEAVTTKVENCWIYKSNGECELCKKGYFQSPFDSTKCIKPSSPISNCLSYTYLICRKCEEGMIMMAENDFFGSHSVEFLPSYLYATTSDLVFQGLFGRSQQDRVCFEKQYGCDPGKSQLCLGCPEGEYLDKDVCKPNPKPAIKNCYLYSHTNTCAECENGFLLENNSCAPVVLVSNCELYDGTASSTVCRACKKDYYLSENECVERQLKSFAGCQTFDPASDNCLECTVGKVLNSQKTSCLFSIDFCASYESTSQESTLHSCESCLDGYYPRIEGGGKKCFRGTVPNCVAYDQSEDNTCSACENGFYLKNSECLQHIILPNCNNYDPFKANACSECNQGFIKLEIQNVCIQRKPIPNCLKPLSDLSGCRECDKRFYLTESGHCAVIPQVLGNCLQANADGSSCSLCAPNEMLFSYPSYNACLQVPNFISNEGVVGPSLSHNPWSTNDEAQIDSDGICAEYQYPVRLKRNDGICVKNSDLKFVSSFKVIRNCRRYSWVSGRDSLVCSHCHEGFFLTNYESRESDSTQLECTDTCDATDNLILLNDLEGFYNICFPKYDLPNLSSSVDLSDCLLIGRVLDTESESLIEHCLDHDRQTALNAFEMQSPSSYQVDTSIETALGSLNHKVLFFGYHQSDRSVKPSVFNYAGMPLFSIRPSEVYFPSLRDNCNILFKMQHGSAYATPTRPELVETNPDMHDYVCLQCDVGYTLEFDKKPAGKWMYAPKCMQNSKNGCDKTILRGGLPSYLNAILSCHSCSNVLSSPVIRIEVMWPNEFVDPSIENDPPEGGSPAPQPTDGYLLQYSLPANFDEKELPFECSNKPYLVPNLEDSSSEASMLNCGVHGIVSRVPGENQLPAETTNFCLACASGHYPKYFQEMTEVSPAFSFPEYVVVQCTASANCDPDSLQKPYNSCGKCLSTSELYFAYSDLLLRNCVSVKTEYCFVSMNGIDCSFCESGYHLNEEGFCETLTFPNMESGASFYSALYPEGLMNHLSDTFPLLTPTINSQPTNTIQQTSLSIGLDDIRLIHLLTFSNVPNGPGTCKSGSSIVPPPKKMMTVCAKSSFLEHPVASDSVHFVKDCQKYFHTTFSVGVRLRCAICVFPKIPNEHFSECHDPVDDCERVAADDSTKCAVCKKGFSNLRGICSSAKITDCNTHFPNENHSETTVLTCAVCEDGFDIDVSSGECVRGPDENCSRYFHLTGGTCAECKHGYLLVALKDSPAFCLPLNGIMSNCKHPETKTDDNDNSVLNCTECLSSKESTFGSVPLLSLSNKGNPNTICLKMSSIDNCEKYDIRSSFGDSSLNCLECRPGYYTTGRTCQAIYFLSEDCQSYSKTLPQCASCKPGMFLDNNSFPPCVPFPKGIPNCVKYLDPLTCIKCPQQYYLKNGVCNLSEEVANCVEYADQKVCSRCASTFFLTVQKTCSPAKAKDCATVTSETACATCEKGKGLKKETVENVEFTNCVEISLPNCFETSTTFPFKCLICNSDYSLSDGSCVKVDSLISNCLFYETQTTCIQCNAGFSLAVDKKKCEGGEFVSRFADPKCIHIETLTNPICNACEPGFKTVNGACVPISKADSNCLIYSSSNPQRCAICDPRTSYMNSTFQCALSLKIEQALPKPNFSELLRNTLLPVFALILEVFLR